jgi:hypothetical protein
MGTASIARSQQSSGNKELTEEQRAQVKTLQAKDREVRAHEAAHQAAAGGLVTQGASFTYQRGADGSLYAIGGKVNIDTSSVPNDPAATLRKAETIIRAALAPAHPSGQDRQVATQAAKMAAAARSELSATTNRQSKVDQFKTIEKSQNNTPSSLDLRA